MPPMTPESRVSDSLTRQTQQSFEKMSIAPANAGRPIATIVIATKNRRNDLTRALCSAFAQTCPVEILVMDDGSNDGTQELVRQDFPDARLVRSEQSRGYIVQRNAAARIAQTPFLFSIDDDATFSSPDVISRTIADFSNPRIGAVAIPCIDVLRSNLPRQPFPHDHRSHVAPQFIGTAYAVRKDVFIQVGGFREELFHQGEERDFCARLYNRGYVVALGTAGPIHHFESPQRDTRRMDIFGRRNDILFPFHNAPWPFLVSHLLGTTFHGLTFGLRQRKMLRSIRGIVRGYFDGVRAIPRREPVQIHVYRLLRQLRQFGSMPMEEAERLLGLN